MECLSHITALLSQIAASGNAATPSLNGPPYDILCLGSGWTYSFLGPVAANAGLKITFTSRTAKSGGFVFAFDPESDDEAPFRALPDAKAIVIIFPLYSKEAVKRLVRGYLKSRLPVGDGDKLDNIVAPNFILLGSTGIWDHGPSFQFAPLTEGSITDEKHSMSDHSGSSSVWKDRHSKVQHVPRAIAEDAFLSLNEENNIVRKIMVPTSVLCLSGLWGHGRSPRRYISVIAPSKERLKALGSVHLVHGHDVARAILAMATQWDKTEAQRWILTNERVYDLWDLCSRWGDAGEAGRDHFPQGPQPVWVQELIAESRSHKKQDCDDSLESHISSHAIRSIPRTVEQMGSALDGTAFWNTFGISPEVPWVD